MWDWLLKLSWHAPMHFSSGAEVSAQSCCVQFGAHGPSTLCLCSARPYLPYLLASVMPGKYVLRLFGTSWRSVSPPVLGLYNTAGLTHHSTLLTALALYNSGIKRACAAGRWDCSGCADEVCERAVSQTRSVRGFWLALDRAALAKRGCVSFLHRAGYLFYDYSLCAV